MEMSELKAYTLMPEPNSTYLSHTKGVPVSADPLSGGTMGLMMILSTFQYQAPYMPSAYSNAMSQAGKAAFIQSGGQAMQDKILSKAQSNAKETMHDVGITDGEAGVVLGTAKIVRDKQIDVKGPKIYFIHTHLTVGQDHGSVGLGINF